MWLDKARASEAKWGVEQARIEKATSGKDVTSAQLGPSGSGRDEHGGARNGVGQAYNEQVSDPAVSACCYATQKLNLLSGIRDWSPDHPKDQQVLPSCGLAYILRVNRQSSLLRF